MGKSGVVPYVGTQVVETKSKPYILQKCQWQLHNTCLQLLVYTGVSQTFFHGGTP
jgi:hypothetical protein